MVEECGEEWVLWAEQAMPPLLIRHWNVDAFLQRLATSRATVNQSCAGLESYSQVISIRIPHMLSGVASCSISPCLLWDIIFCVGVCCFLGGACKLQSALQMPCLSSEHGGKSSGIRLPGGRVHRWAFCRGPGGYHNIVFLFVANAKGVVTFSVCAHVSRSSKWRLSRWASKREHELRFVALWYHWRNRVCVLSTTPVNQMSRMTYERLVQRGDSKVGPACPGVVHAAGWWSNLASYCVETSGQLHLIHLTSRNIISFRCLCVRRTSLLKHISQSMLSGHYLIPNQNVL